jgi:hypothetical protein
MGWCSQCARSALEAWPQCTFVCTRGVGVVLVEEVVAVAPTEGPVRVVEPVRGRTDPETRGVDVVVLLLNGSLQRM